MKEKIGFKTQALHSKPVERKEGMGKLSGSYRWEGLLEDRRRGVGREG